MALVRQLVDELAERVVKCGTVGLSYSPLSLGCRLCHWRICRLDDAWTDFLQYSRLCDKKWYRVRAHESCIQHRANTPLRRELYVDTASKIKLSIATLLTLEQNGLPMDVIWQIITIAHWISPSLENSDFMLDDS